VRTEIIRAWAPLGQLEGEWNTLLSSSGADTIFLRWEWIQAWGEAVGRAHPLLVVGARDSQGALAGVAPFYRSTLRLFGRVPSRTLRLLGDYPTGSEYPTGSCGCGARTRQSPRSFARPGSGSRPPPPLTTEDRAGAPGPPARPSRDGAGRTST